MFGCINPRRVFEGAPRILIYFVFPLLCDFFAITLIHSLSYGSTCLGPTPFHRSSLWDLVIALPIVEIIGGISVVFLSDSHWLWCFSPFSRRALVPSPTLYIHTLSKINQCFWPGEILHSSGSERWTESSIHSPFIYSSLSKCSRRVRTTCLLVSEISPARKTSSRMA